MSTLLAENFDGVTAPALPTGWTWGTGYATTASPSGGITPTSSPNCLALATTGTGNHIYSFYNTADGNGGDLTIQVNVNGTGAGHQAWGLLARASSHSSPPLSTTCYWLVYDAFNQDLTQHKILSGTPSIVGSSLSLSSATLPEWYQVTHTLSGTSLSTAIQDLGTGDWLNSSGVWQAGAATALSVTDSSITGSGFYGLSGVAASGPIYFDDMLVTTAGGGSPTVLYAADFGTGSEASSLARIGGDGGTGLESVSLTATLTTADAGIPGDSSLRSAIVGDGGASAECSLSLGMGGDAGASLDATLACLAAGDVLSSVGTSLAMPMGGDSGSAIEASLSSLFTGGFVYAADGGAADDSASLIVSLTGDLSADAEAFAAAQVIVAADGAYFDDSTALSILATAVGYTSTDGASGTESAPAPTAWATDTAAAGADQFAASLGGDSGSGGTGGALDRATGSEAWSLASVVVACDRGYPDSAWAQAALIIACDAATAAELAAIGLLTVGYHIYASPAVNQPIDYSTVVATILGFDNTTWTSSTLAVPGAWSFGVRAFNDAGEEANLDCSVTVLFDASGRDISAIPAPPVGLRAIATAGAGIEVIWGYPAVGGPKKPTGFHIYYTAGATLSYATPAATVAANTGIAGAFRATLSGVNGVSYTIGVRAYNASGPEQNQNVVTCVADGVGPTAVTSLVATLIP